jgi:hypothetical protein
VLHRFENLRFTCEWKYDGERAQVRLTVYWLTIYIKPLLWSVSLFIKQFFAAVADKITFALWWKPSCKRKSLVPTACKELLFLTF